MASDGFKLYLGGKSDTGPVKVRRARRSAELPAQSQRRLAVILPLLPPGLRKAVRGGPFDNGDWCLLVDHTAAAAKLRQLMPTFKLALESKGLAVTAVRVKVQQAAWK